MYNRPRDAHMTEERKFLYPWPPWARRCVHVHQVIDKADRARCRHRMAHCRCPRVGPKTLGVLVTLLQDATANSHTPSQLEDSGAASGPHDANPVRGPRASPRHISSICSPTRTTALPAVGNTRPDFTLLPNAQSVANDHLRALASPGGMRGRPDARVHRSRVAAT